MDREDELDAAVALYVDVLNAHGPGSDEEREAFARLGTDERTRRLLATAKLISMVVSRKRTRSSETECPE